MTTPKLKLHELSDLALDIERRLDALAEIEDASERDDGLREALSLIEGDIKENATALATLVLNREADAAALQHQADLFQARADGVSKRAQAIRNGADGLRDYIAGCLASLGPETQKLNGNGLVAVTLSKESKEKLHVVEPAELPREYRIDVLEVPAENVPVSLVGFTTGHKANKDALARDGADELPPSGTEMRVPKRRLLIR